MAQKEKIKESLENILNNIEEFESGDIDWYYEQVTLDDDNDDFRSTDQKLMTLAFQYPDLHPLMRQVVQAITETNVSQGEVWDQDEEHAGTNAALLLALANKDDVPLYAYFIASNDLNHPVYQEEDWQEVFAKWGECEETLLLLIAITLVPGQWFDTESYWDEFAEYLKKDDNINIFLRQFHFFILWANEKDVYLRDTDELVKKTLPNILPDDMAGNEELIDHLVSRFSEYPEVPEPPTMEILMEGYGE